MKKLILLAFLGITTSASALDVTFAWDQNPENSDADATNDVVRYRIHLYDEATDAWIPLGDAADNPATPENDTPTTLRVPAFPDSESRVRATAINSHGLESLPSDEIIVRLPPGKPTGLRYTINLSGELTLTPVP